jgi:hypothetical protein
MKLCKHSMKLISTSSNKVKSTSNYKPCKCKSTRECKILVIKTICFSQFSNSCSNRWIRIFSNSSKFSRPAKQWAWEMRVDKLRWTKLNNSSKFNSSSLPNKCSNSKWSQMALVLPAPISSNSICSSQQTCHSRTSHSRCEYWEQLDALVETVSLFSQNI